MNSDPANENAGAFEPEFLSQTFLERNGISPVLFAFISLILVFFLYQGVGGIVTVILFGLEITGENVAGLRIATLFGQMVFILVPALLLTRLATGDPNTYLRIQPPQPVALIIPLVGIFSLQQVLQVFMVYQEKIPIPTDIQPFVEQMKQLIEETYKVLVSSTSLPELLFVLLVIAFVPAVAEELLFRGMIQRSFERGLGSKRGLLLTALIFAVYHLNPFSFLPLIGLGLYLGFLALRSGSIFVPMAAHFYNNAFACIAVYIGMTDNYIVTGEATALSNTELVMTFIVFSLVFFLSTYYFIRVTASQTSSMPT